MSHFRWVKSAGAFGMAALALRPDDVLYVPLPLYHSSALAVAWSAAASTGAALALRRRFSVSAFWEDVRRFHATSFVYIGELCRYLLNQPPRADDRCHTVRKIVGNGCAPTSGGSSRCGSASTRSTSSTGRPRATSRSSTC